MTDIPDQRVAYLLPSYVSNLLPEVMTSSKSRMVVDQGAEGGGAPQFVHSWSSEPAVKLSHEMLATLDEAGVSVRFK